MQIIKNGGLVEDCWQHIEDGQALPNMGDITVSYNRWLEEGESLSARNGRLGLRIRGNDPLEVLGPCAGQFPLLVVEFSGVADGRGFSLARLLRDQYGYQGELRAYGHFIRDQVFFLQRVGCNSFESTLAKAVDLLPGLDDLTVRYQASQDERLPLYRRR